jgi:hypothetical protein
MGIRPISQLINRQLDPVSYQKENNRIVARMCNTKDKYVAHILVDKSFHSLGLVHSIKGVIVQAHTPLKRYRLIPVKIWMQPTQRPPHFLKITQS